MTTNYNLGAFAVLSVDEVLGGHKVGDTGVIVGKYTPETYRVKWDKPATGHGNVQAVFRNQVALVQSDRLFQVGDTVAYTGTMSNRLRGLTGVITKVTYQDDIVVKWDSRAVFSSGSVMGSNLTLRAPVKPATPKFSVGDIVELTDHPYNNHPNQSLKFGTYYKVERVSPSGKSIKLVGILGNKTSDRFKLTDPLAGRAFFPDIMTAPYGTVSGRVSGRRADYIIADDVVPAKPKKAPAAIVVPTADLYDVIASYLKDNFGIEGKVKGICSDISGTRVALA